MSAQDDPEERIRELERSLSDRSAELTQSSTEMGHGQYGAPPVNPAPPPPFPPPAYGGQPPYGGPFPPMPMPMPMPSGGGGGGGGSFLMVGVMALIAMGIIAGIVLFFSDVASEVSSFIAPSSSPTVDGGGGPFGVPPSRSGANRPQITVAGPTVSRAPSGGDIGVSGVGENRTIECNDGAVTVSGVSNTVVLTGHCASVTISGIENVVTIDEADTISASGFDNRVTYRTGAPEILNSGSSNVVERG